MCIIWSTAFGLIKLWTCHCYNRLIFLIESLLSCCYSWLTFRRVHANRYQRLRGSSRLVEVQPLLYVSQRNALYTRNIFSSFTTLLPLSLHFLQTERTIWWIYLTPPIPSFSAVIACIIARSYSMLLPTCVNEYFIWIYAKQAVLLPTMPTMMSDEIPQCTMTASFCKAISCLCWNPKFCFRKRILRLEKVSALYPNKKRFSYNLKSDEIWRRSSLNRKGFRRIDSKIIN